MNLHILQYLYHFRQYSTSVFCGVLLIKIAGIRTLARSIIDSISMNDVESTKNLYSFAIVIGFIITIIGIFIASWMRVKVRHAVLEDIRVMRRPKRWMWIIGIVSVLMCLIYLVVWYLFLHKIDSI